MKRTLLAAAIALTFSAGASAAEVKPAVVYDMGGKFDKSFNEGVSHGVAKFAKESGQDVVEFEPSNDSQIEQGLKRMAKRGYNPVIAVGFNQANALAKVADEFPETHFAIIDMVVDKPNVESIVFKEHEGSFLVGALAAMKSQTGKVGFIGGMDIGLIRKFECGYEQGAKYINPKVEVFANMTGSTPAAWNNPGKGGELAKSQFDRGADVVFAAAGGTGVGVYQAAADEGKYAIGVDSNQNYLHPGTMLTSMVKSVDVAAYNTIKDVQDGTWKPGVKVLGLADNGVSWAYDQYNKDLVTADMKAKMDEIQKDIVDGKINVHDYMSDNSCQ
ncbi:BMP family lipoprotein [Pokkaliibacter sp. CJK22405]|uniref:BMP family lipoprotein n=1 Tax=Pokkaliibacter sp. CJK22405 TaxID=3384615 RepID=UPI0039846D47